GAVHRPKQGAVTPPTGAAHDLEVLARRGVEHHGTPRVVYLETLEAHLRLRPTEIANDSGRRLGREGPLLEAQRGQRPDAKMLEKRPRRVRLKERLVDRLRRMVRKHSHSLLGQQTFRGLQPPHL